MNSHSEPVRAVLRLRAQAPYGVNGTQTEIIDRLDTLFETGRITEFDIDVWGTSMGINVPEGRDPGGVRETVAEFEQWAADHDCTLRPAFNRRRTGLIGDGEENRSESLVLPVLCLAVYDGETIKAVYPHGDGEDVRTIHDGVEALESMATTGEHSGEEGFDEPPLSVQ